MLSSAPPRPSWSRCSSCNPRKVDGTRNLIVGIDGTSNKFGQNNTNVVKLLAAVDMETGPEQLTYYLSGIGTGPKSLHRTIKRALSDAIDMAVAWNIGENVKNAYSWLAQTYQEGDQIYLFGFSRGAYQVRMLAGMIHEVGLIRTPMESQIETAYGHYQAIRSGKSHARENARRFKNAFSQRSARVHFVGLWDTVSSEGLIRGDVFHSSVAHACYFRHALALDEFRVKFVPEYLHGENTRISRYIVTSPDVEKSATLEDERIDFAVKPTDICPQASGDPIKEVWFAGSHSDVGGLDRLGKFRHAGKVSLLWMRREASAYGLMLEPTDLVWTPGDLDFGTSNSMGGLWRAIEYLPIKHQVSLGGISKDVRRWHLLEPRCVIPGQKVHASVLCANSYKPKATLGTGFDPSMIQLEDTETNNQLWEESLLDDTAAQTLLACLDYKQYTPIYLDRLLFMLRFEEGKQSIRNVPDWQAKFMKLLHDHDCPPLVRMIATVAYYEASCETHPQSHTAVTELSQDVFDDMKACLTVILATHKHRDGLRVLALLRPLTKHKILRERILTSDFLETVMRLLDVIIRLAGGNFGQAMDGLNCLLQCDDTRQTLVERLGANSPDSDVSRLSRILMVKDPGLLVAALRMMLTLSRIPGPRARAVCSVVKPRIRELASKDEQQVGLLAVEILLALYDPNDRDQLNIRNTHVRTNLVSALVRLSPDGHDSSGSDGRNVNPGRQILSRLFGIGSTELNAPQKKLIEKLKRAVQKGKAQQRITATMTLLKQCETESIRAFLREIHLLDVFVRQLEHKDSALLAAYALTTCLKYNDLKESIKDNADLPKHIVGMLRLDYFDDTVGRVEGFQIFGDFMRHAKLRENIKDYNITEVLHEKLGKGHPRGIRTSMICLDIFQTFDPDGPWTCELVAISLEHLRNPEWKVQKIGVTALSALAQTDRGVHAIKLRMDEVVEMLLPEGYLPIASVPKASSIHSSLHVTSRSSAWMMGPACALRILTLDPVLREHTRETVQYGSLKYLYQSEMLLDRANTSPWRVNTPNRTDVLRMLDKVIKTVDGEVLEGYLSIGDIEVPRIQHRRRLVRSLGSKAKYLAVLGIPALAAVAMIVVPPVYLGSRAHCFFQGLASRYENSRLLDKLRRRRSSRGWPSDFEDILAFHEEEDVLGGQGGESSQGVDMTHACVVQRDPGVVS